MSIIISIILALLAIATIIFCIKRWKLALIFVFILMCIDGAIRRILYDNMIVYLLKDFLLIFIYVGFFLESKKIGRKILFRNGLNAIFLLIAIINVIYLFSPHLNNFLVGLVGIKLNLLYIPLFYLGYHFFDSNKKLMSFIKKKLYVAVVISIIVIVQFLIGPIASLTTSENFMPWLDTRSSDGVKIYKPEATFAAAAILGWFINTMAIFAIGTMNFPILILILIAIIVGASKGAYILFILILFLFSIHKPKFFMPIILITILALILSVVFIPEAFKNTVDRMELVYSKALPWLRAYDNIKSGLDNIDTLKLSWFGNGTGIATLGSRYVMAEDDYFNFETDYINLLIQFGIPGPLLYIIMFITIFASGYKIYFKITDIKLQMIALSIIIFTLEIFLGTLTTSVLNHAVISIYFFFICGVLFRLPDMEHKFI